MTSFGDTYLAFADLFPARAGGEPWGDERVIVRIASNSYVCDGLSKVQADDIRARFSGMCVDTVTDAARTVTLRIYRVELAEFSDPNPFWRTDFDLDYAPESVRIAGHHVMARFDWKPRLQAALWTCEEQHFVDFGVFENVLRMTVAYHLLEQGGALMHSAAVAGNGTADVFFGPSGAGKSTISRLGFETGHQVLSDDMNALWVTGEALAVEKLPFAGDFGASLATAHGVFPVRHLGRLRKGTVPALQPMSEAQAMAALIQSAPFVNRDPYRYELLLKTLLGIQARHPVAMLTFPPDPQTWTYLDANAP